MDSHHSFAQLYNGNNSGRFLANAKCNLVCTVSTWFCTLVTSVFSWTAAAVVCNTHPAILTGRVADSGVHHLTKDTSVARETVASAGTSQQRTHATVLTEAFVALC